jgi:hypothetical protein
MVEEITFENTLYAIIIYASYKDSGLKFFTPNHFSQQLAYMNHPKGKIIEPHAHNLFLREIKFTQEVLYIKSGKVRVDFYSEERKLLGNKILNCGDFILLASGGHGFEMLENSEII